MTGKMMQTTMKMISRLSILRSAESVLAMS
jgi:hypothetical protein